MLYREKKELERGMGGSVTVAVSAQMGLGVGRVGTPARTKEEWASSNTIFHQHVLYKLVIWEISF